MIQTINPYATARTAEIMSRYRPIAPKPETPATDSAAENDSSAVPTGIRKSPYLRNVWAHLQARPTRTRKRGRAAAFAPPSIKRTRTCLPGPYQGLITSSPAKNLAMHGFTHHAAANGQQMAQFSLVPLNCGLDTAVTTLAESVALPLVSSGGFRRPAVTVTDKGKEKGIDLNQGPEELDLSLEPPAKPAVIISPRLVRPVGSSIIVKGISGDLETQTVANGAEEVEELAEAEAVPAIVSDSNNKVRIANSAYREMVGQPECGWLDCAAGKRSGGAWKRIGGEVSLQFVDTDLQLSARGFTCRVKIVWESDGKNNCVNASCVGVRLACQAKDYQFLWRFHAVDESSEAAALDD